MIVKILKTISPLNSDGPLILTIYTYVYINVHALQVYLPSDVLFVVHDVTCLGSAEVVLNINKEKKLWNVI